ncbi:MAG TPA: EpsI family protein [Terriglobales bacterium]|nr:EpsI family protein [Terriglobales bacterium]
MMPFRSRVAFAACLLMGGVVMLQALGRRETVPPRQPLSGFPVRLGPWTGRNEPLPERIVQAVGVTDYLSRVYWAQQEPVQLYIGYYRSQRTGDTIHSPKNCLPGAGWAPVRSGDLAIPISGFRSIVVNEYVVEKGLSRDLVLYWYQARGRAVASEYWAKLWMIEGALRENRTDGALVRVWTPIERSEGLAAARARAVAFTRLVYPRLSRFIPN